HEIQATDTVDTIYQRAAATARQFLAHGTTTIRTHVDVNQFTGLRGVEALLRLRADLGSAPRLQLVALTHPLSGESGSANLALVEEALRMGVDAVGGAPALTDDPRAEIDQIFALALRAGKPIDLHVDESDTPADFCLPYLAAKTIAECCQGKVIAGHCCSLSAVDDDAAARAIDLVREAGIGVVTLPSANMYLQGRSDQGCVRRGLTRVRQLMAAGVLVACGSDNIRDPFNPFGRADPLLVANLLAHAAHMGSPSEQARAIEAITTTPARMLGLPEASILPGQPADLVVLDTDDWGGALAAVPPRRFVIAGGALAAETRTSTWVHSLVAGT
ncbi:MAG: amidohydrolase family protein, partial [Chloroflexota bacterium]